MQLSVKLPLLSLAAASVLNRKIPVRVYLQAARSTRTDHRNPMKNIAGIDRYLRLLLAVLLLLAGFFWLAGTPALLAYGLAAVMLVTSAWGFCPLYRVLGISGQRNAAPQGLPLRLAGFALLLAVARTEPNVPCCKGNTCCK